MTDLTEEENIFRLGMNAGEVFADKVRELFVEFRKNYETADPNFSNDIYLEGFDQGFFDNVDFGK